MCQLDPEEQAREKIDKMLEDNGWRVVSRKEFVPNEALAVKEGLLKKNKEADYLLFLSGKAVGVLEAKPENVDVNTPKVIDQAEGYTRKLLPWCQFYENPLPLVWLSNGKQYYFRDMRSMDKYQKIERIHSPKEVVKMLNITDRYAGLPMLKERGLRGCQYKAIKNLEKSLKDGNDRALMVLATGSGKTFLAIDAAYRLLNYAKFKKVLFLVDRNNLGRQAERDFGLFKLTESGEPFNTIYEVERLKSGEINTGANVLISTIQRLFSLLSGRNVEDDEDEEDTRPDDADGESVTLPGNPKLPHDYFDLIIIDECHRSIYSSWKAVLDYFDTAIKIGLTATPAPQTLAFFEQNIVINYTLEESILDHVNVGSRTYRIKTEQTENGGFILEGDKVTKETVYTKKVEDVVNEEDESYSSEELNRSVINPAQIKLILETYKNAVYAEMFTDPQRDPNFDYLPKTLIFALNERHANNIVKIANEVFERQENDGFVQKITYRSGNTDQLIKNFCNDRKFRIAVTVTLVSTGIDIKPLEVVMFMRFVRSSLLYTQMKGRGVRTVSDDILRSVTPNATSKDLYYLVDAVGVTEGDHDMPSISGGRGTTYPSLPLLLEKLAHGEVSDDNLIILANRVSRIDAKIKTKEKEKFNQIAGIELRTISQRIFDSYNPVPKLPPYIDINESNTERKQLVKELAENVDAREYLCELSAGYVKTLNPGEDNLISKGFTIEESQSAVTAFEEYVNTHRDQIEALQYIYSGKPVNRSMLEDLEKKLKDANLLFERHRLWNCYGLVYPDKVKHFKNEETAQRNLLTNLIQLVRYAYRQIDNLDTISVTANRYFNLWCGQVWRGLTEEQKEIFRYVKDYIVTNGSCSLAEFRSIDEASAAKLIMTMGSIEAAEESFTSLSQFIIYKKAA